ncbi:MAG: hypothetical protein US49_C0006G0141 [candidate division TM6 bacterium GW2011_GWF2_37_49]|nr:MAG: hypothetical protein US49_C0006G0141 [candidate division TM6 bacterium GW2011_GWF2_37_49]
MNKLPYFRNGRFYNDEKDSVKSRLWHAAKVFLKSLPKYLLKKNNKKSVLAELNGWKDLSNSLVDSIKSQDQFSVTWIGHSTFLIKLADTTILTDPIFFNVSKFFPRYADAAFTIDKLPKIDFVLISHNHRDHFDLPSLRLIETRDKPTFLVPLGDAKLLKKNGFVNVFEKHWWDVHSCPKSMFEFTFLPAVHWTGRGPFDINKSLWGSWMLQMNGFKIYFAGDSAAGSHFCKIGKRFEGIDVALMPIGPCYPREFMAESHLDSHEAVQAFLDLGANHFIPMHWGTFKSGFESVLHPIEVLQLLWLDKNEMLKGKMLSILKFGQTSIFDKKC